MFQFTNCIYVGDVCRAMKDSVPNYVCTRHDKCKPLEKMINIQEHPDVCSFVGLKPIVCCPSSATQISVPDIKQGNPDVVNESTYVTITLCPVQSPLNMYNAYLS